MRVKHLVALAFLQCALLGVACSQAHAATPSAQVTYRCNQQQVVALYDNSAADTGRAIAWVHDGSQTHRLPLVRTASGARYTDGLWSWWGRRGEARLDRKGKPTLTACRTEQTRRVLIDRRTRTQWVLPPAWTEARVEESMLQGAAAEAAQPAAQVLARYSVKAETPGAAAPVLAQLMVFETPAWETLTQAGTPPGEVVLRTPKWIYAMQLADTAPQPAAAAASAASAAEAEPAAPAADLHAGIEDSLRAGLQLWGRGPLLETCRVSGSVSYRERIALVPGDELQVQLLDVTRADETPKVLAEHRRALGKAQVPLRYSLSCGDPEERTSGETRLVVRASIVRDGRPLFATETAQPVLTQGHGREANLVLTRLRDKPARPSRDTSR